MILVYKNGLLNYKNKIYKCSLGKNGVTNDKIEGDGRTPLGSFNLGPLYYRSDRIKKINTLLKTIPTEKDMYWSDYPESIYYNKLINFKDKSFESLFINENIYDIIIVIKYNTNPIVPYKGSAIFLHLTKKNYSKTKGCIALKKDCLLEILELLSPNEKIKILPSNYN